MTFQAPEPAYPSTTIYLQPRVENSLPEKSITQTASINRALSRHQPRARSTTTEPTMCYIVQYKYACNHPASSTIQACPSWEITYNKGNRNASGSVACPQFARIGYTKVTQLFSKCAGCVQR